jgi:hypothetical protein
MEEHDDYVPGSFGDLNSGGRNREEFQPKPFRSRMKNFLIFILIVVALAIAAHHSSRNNPESSDVQSSSSVQIPSDQPVPISMNFYGCRDQDYFRRMQEYVTVHDREAFDRAYLTGLATGQCIELKAGTSVFLEDRAFLSGLVQVRPRGSTDLLWTQPSAVGIK